MPDIQVKLDPSTLDRGRGTLPLYEQLTDHLRQLVVTHDLLPNEALPSEGKLAELADVSVPVVRQALDRLAEEGLIVKRSGTSTRVAVPPEVRRIDAGRYLRELRKLIDGEQPETSFVSEHAGEWEAYTLTNLEYSEEAASQRDQELLGLAPGDQVLRRRMVKCLDDAPLQIQRSAVPLKMARGTVLADPSRQPVPGGTLAELFEAGLIPTTREEFRGTQRRRFTVIEEIAPSRRPDGTERRLLRIPASAEVRSVERVFVVDGKPVEASRVIVPAARYVLRYETDLSL